MFTPCQRYVIVYNGEIYNVRRLRAKLQEKGVHLRSSSDTEVLINLFASEGLRCVDLLEGMFAFAVVDLMTRRLFLCRDRSGEKPLFYCLVGDTFYFASEIKAFHEVPGLSLRIDPNAVIRYFLHTQAPPPFSFFETVRRLEPGHWMVVASDGRKTRFPYWKLDFTDKADLSERELLDRLEELLFSRVRDALVSDSPQGVLLSGGIDSSLVYAAARATDAPLECFTIVGSGDPIENPDFEYAREQARQSGHPHHLFRFHMPSFEGVVESMAELDEPIAVFDSVMSVQHCRSIAPHRRVVLSGSGADEVFGGYDSYLNLAANGTKSRSETMDALLAEISTDLRARSLADGDVLFATQLGDMARDIVWEQEIAWLGDVANVDNRLDSKLLMELLIGMSHCASMFDSVGMAASIEIRSPFLNHRVLEFAARLPLHQKVTAAGPYRTKRLLKQLAERHIPPGIIRRRKTGYSFGFDPLAAVAGPWRVEIDNLVDRHHGTFANLIDLEKARQVLICAQNASASELERRRATKFIMLLAWVESKARQAEVKLS